MSKAAETLGSLHRFLVLVATALLLFAWKSGGDEFRYTHALLQARLMVQQHAYLATGISRDTGPFYSQHWCDMLQNHVAELPDHNLLSWFLTKIKSARFLPETIDIVEQVRPDDLLSPRFLALTLAFARDRLTLAQLAAAARLAAPQGALDLYEFDVYPLLWESEWLIRRRPPVMNDHDLTIFVGLAKAGNCTLRFRSGKSSPVRVTIPCHLYEQTDASTLVRSLFVDEAPPYHYPRDLPRTLMQLPYSLAEAQLMSLAEREQRRADSELELLGLKLDGNVVGTVGPFAIFGILLQMLATLPRHPDEEKVKEAEAWYDLFGGWRLWIMLITLVVLPAGAIIATALRPMQAGDVEPGGWQVAIDLVAANVVAGAGLACLARSRKAARKWLIEKEEFAPRSSDKTS